MCKNLLLSNAHCFDLESADSSNQISHMVGGKYEQIFSPIFNSKSCAYRNYTGRRMWADFNQHPLFIESTVALKSFLITLRNFFQDYLPQRMRESKLHRESRFTFKLGKSVIISTDPTCKKQVIHQDEPLPQLIKELREDRSGSCWVPLNDRLFTMAVQRMPKDYHSLESMEYFKTVTHLYHLGDFIIFSSDFQHAGGCGFAQSRSATNNTSSPSLCFHQYLDSGISVEKSSFADMLNRDEGCVHSTYCLEEEITPFQNSIEKENRNIKRKSTEQDRILIKNISKYPSKRLKRSDETGRFL